MCVGPEVPALPFGGWVEGGGGWTAGWAQRWPHGTLALLEHCGPAVARGGFLRSGFQPWCQGPGQMAPKNDLAHRPASLTRARAGHGQEQGSGTPLELTRSPEPAPAGSPWP